MYIIVTEDRIVRGPYENLAQATGENFHEHNGVIWQIDSSGTYKLPEVLMHAYPDPECTWGYMLVCARCIAKGIVPSTIDLTKAIENPPALGKIQGCEVCKRDRILSAPTRVKFLVTRFDGEVPQATPLSANLEQALNEYLYQNPPECDEWRIENDLPADAKVVGRIRRVEDVFEM